MIRVLIGHPPGPPHHGDDYVDVEHEATNAVPTVLLRVGPDVARLSPTEAREISAALTAEAEEADR